MAKKPRKVLLGPSTVSKPIAAYVDCDYADQLNQEEKEWLSQFYQETYNDKAAAYDSPLHPDKETQKQLRHARYAMRVDIVARGCLQLNDEIAGNQLEFYPSAEEIYMAKEELEQKEDKIRCLLEAIAGVEDPDERVYLIKVKLAKYSQIRWRQTEGLSYKRAQEIKKSAIDSLKSSFRQLSSSE